VIDPTVRPALDGAGLRALKAEVDAGRRALWRTWERAVQEASDAGMSERAIAEAMDVQRLTVRRWLGRA
jgi:hypothetical protein